MRKQLLKVIAIGAVTFFVGSQKSFSQWNLTGNANATATSLLGTTNSISLRLATKNTPRLIIDTLGRVGIGITVPTTQLMVRGSGGNPAAIWTNIGKPVFGGFGETNVGNADFILGMASAAAANATGRFAGRRSRGTLAAPAAVINGDQLMSFSSFGFDNTGAFQNPANIEFTVDGIPAGTAVPTSISFATGNNGVSRQERMRIGSGGTVSVTSGNLDVLSGNIGIAAGGNLNMAAGSVNVASGNLNLTTGDANVGGNLNMTSDLKTIQFANPSASSAAMMTMFQNGTVNPDRMVIAHSSAYPNWGLQYSDAADKFNFLGQGNPVMSVNLYPGSVGIGTTTPGAKFDIVGSGTYDLSGSYPDFRLGDATYNLKMGVANGGGGAGDAYLAGSGRLYLGTSNTFTRSQTVAVNPDGTVGIGGYFTSSKLGVTGDTISYQPVISATATYTGGSSDVRGIQSTSIIAPGYGYGVHGTGGYMGGYFYANASSYSGFGFGVYGNATGTAGTRFGVYGIASGGTVNNWGGYFPTKTYTSELRVGGEQGATGYVAAINGKLIATEVRVDVQANWPDYVFSGTHKMLPIDDLEAYLSKDKHLPGVPSAQEVKDGGIMLGEMQTKAMEKIEEATLYIVQLNNKIKELEKKIDALSNKK